MKNQHYKERVYLGTKEKTQEFQNGIATFRRETSNKEAYQKILKLKEGDKVNISIN